MPASSRPSRSPSRSARTTRGASTELIGLRQLVPLAPLGVLRSTSTIGSRELLPDLREKTGAVIVAIAPDAPYSQQGKLKPGDVIRAVNGKTIAPSRICWS